MNKPLIIYGTSNFTRVSIKEIMEEFSVVAFTADKKYITEDSYLGLPLIDFDEIENVYPAMRCDMMVLRSHRDMEERQNSFNRAKEKGYYLPNFISKKANIGEMVNMGENNLIFANVYLGPFGKMRDNNVFRPNTYIGHDFDIGSHIYISPGCNVAGYCQIDSSTFIGLGSVIVDNLHIENNTFIGAGSLLLHDTLSNSLYYGHPCEKVNS